MKMTDWKLPMLALFIVGALGGCDIFHDDDDDDDEVAEVDPPAGGAPPPTEDPNLFATIIEREPNDEPVNFDDPDALRDDIVGLFGEPNSEPQEPEDVLDLE